MRQVQEMTYFTNMPKEFEKRKIEDLYSKRWGIKVAYKTLKTQLELEMAKTLINSMTNKFAPEAYHDEYQAKLHDAIQTKINGQEVVVADDSQPNSVIDLMSALQQSIDLANTQASNNMAS